MKKMILGLCALVACFVFASCSNYADKVKSLTEDLKSAEKAEDFVKIMKDAAQLNIDFYKSEPTAEEEKAFQEAGKEFAEALTKIDGDKAKALAEAMKQLAEDEDFKKLNEEANKAEKEWKDKNKEDKKEGENEDKE